jgi:hypothetical protein
MTVLTPSNAFPGIPFPNHLAGQSKPQNYQYPGAVQPQSSTPTVLTFGDAFPGIPFPNHLSGQSHPQNYLFPGAVQPIVQTVFGGSMIFTRKITFTVTGSVEVTLP